MPTTNTPSEIEIRTELVRPDLDDSPTRFSGYIDGEQVAEAIYTPPPNPLFRSPRDPKVSWSTYSDHGLDYARAHIAVVQAALDMAEAALGIDEGGE